MVGDSIQASGMTGGATGDSSSADADSPLTGSPYASPRYWASPLFQSGMGRPRAASTRLKSRTEYRGRGAGAPNAAVVVAPTVVLMPRFDARGYLEAIHNHQVHVLTGVPTMLSLMLKETDLLNSLDLSSVRAISVGSAPLSETLIERVREVFPNARISNGYGTTEAEAGMFGAHPDGVPVPSLSLGYPQPHVSVRLVGGADDDQGVLQVKTPAAMSEYLNQPEKTDAKVDGDGWIDTGDLMRRDGQGFYYFVGRDDDMFNCGGENVYPGEVERILESDPRVAESCVVPLEDEIKGHKPVAFVVTAVGVTLTEEAVRQVALAGAPAYMHPRHVFFLERMPLAGTNKIDRKALTTLAAERTAPHRN